MSTDSCRAWLEWLKISGIRRVWSSLEIQVALTHWGQDKIAAISQTVSSDTISYMKLLYFDSVLRKCISNDPINKKRNIGSHNGMAPKGGKPMFERVVNYIIDITK